MNAQTETPVAAASEDPCAYDLGAMMNLPYEAFEHDMDGGWRPLGNTKGCEGAAADLLETYRVDRTEAQRRSLMHHEAQLRAAAGDTAAATALIKALLPLELTAEMKAYREAEIAFLSRDLTALKTARAKLLVVPAPDGFAKSVERFREAFPEQPAPTWPINLDVVDGLIACFDKPYAEAYSAACRPAMAAP